MEQEHRPKIAGIMERYKPTAGCRNIGPRKVVAWNIGKKNIRVQEHRHKTVGGLIPYPNPVIIVKIKLQVKEKE